MNSVEVVSTTEYCNPMSHPSHLEKKKAGHTHVMFLDLRGKKRQPRQMQLGSLRQCNEQPLPHAD
jgi:hypothetical protein